MNYEKNLEKNKRHIILSFFSVVMFSVFFGIDKFLIFFLIFSILNICGFFDYLSKGITKEFIIEKKNKKPFEINPIKKEKRNVSKYIDIKNKEIKKIYEKNDNEKTKENKEKKEIKESKYKNKYDKYDKYNKKYKEENNEISIDNIDKYQKNIDSRKEINRIKDNAKNLI